MQNRVPLIWIVLPVLPVFLGFVLLNILNDGSINLLTDAVEGTQSETENAALRFFNAVIVFAAVGLFQVLGCFAVAVFAAVRLRDMPLKAQRTSLLVFLASVSIVIAISVAARQDGFIGALNIAYRSTCAVIVDSGVVFPILPGNCREAGVSHFAWLGLLPYLAGILAAASTSALVSTASFQKDLQAWAEMIEQSFRATAFVLVASTLTMMLFYHLPLAVISDDSAGELIKGFAQGMTLFWGIVFSLTLLAVFGPAQLMLSRAVATDRVVAPELREQILDRSTHRQATRILTALAPLLVGSSATVLEMLAGALAS